MSNLMPYGKDSAGLTKFADANDSLVNFGQVFEFLRGVCCEINYQ